MDSHISGSVVIAGIADILELVHSQDVSSPESVESSSGMSCPSCPETAPTTNPGLCRDLRRLMRTDSGRALRRSGTQLRRGTRPPHRRAATRPNQFDSGSPAAVVLE